MHVCRLAPSWHSRIHKADFWEHVGATVKHKKNPLRNPLPREELQKRLGFVPRTGFIYLLKTNGIRFLVRLAFDTATK